MKGLGCLAGIPLDGFSHRGPFTTEYKGPGGPFNFELLLLQYYEQFPNNTRIWLDLETEYDKPPPFTKEYAGTIEFHYAPGTKLATVVSAESFTIPNEIRR